jgi:hypothetical protein
MRLLTIFLALALFLSACSGAATPQVVYPTSSGAPTSSGEVVVQNETAYPPPVIAAYPAVQQPEQAQQFPTVTIAPDLGQVKGIIKYNGKPVVNSNIYVSPVIQADDGTRIAVKFTRDSPLNGVTDQEGKFLVPNIPAGTYGLVYDIAYTSVLLNHPKTGDQMVFDVQPGQVVDFGELDFQELPNPEE